MPQAPVDVLFVTRLRPAIETGEGAVYEPLRLELLGRIATIPTLRSFATALESGDLLQCLASAPMKVEHEPVLTPIYLHEYLRARGISLESISCLEYERDRFRELAQQGTLLIALCTTWIVGTAAAEQLRQDAALIRSWAPHVPIIAGGAGVRKALRVRELLQQGHLTDWNREELTGEYLLLDAARDGVLDAVVTSEGGEEVLVQIVERLRGGQDFRDLPNLAIPGGSAYRLTEQKLDGVDLDAEVIDWSRQLPALGGQPAQLRAGRGCPFHCEFCELPSMYRVKLRSDASLLAELRTLQAAPPAQREFVFTDDNIAASKSRFVRLAQALVTEKLELNWRGCVRADAIDEEFAHLLHDAGCQECQLGMESADPQVLRNMNKRLDPEQALRAIELLDRVGISTLSFFVVGFPGETAHSIERTARFISAFPSGNSARARHRYYLFRFQLGALCPVALPDRRRRFGLRGSGESWSHATMTAEEAKEAVRELFLQVQGPAHTYLESTPRHWTTATVREITELRDRVQKNRLRGHGSDGVELLLEATRRADAAVQTPAGACELASGR
jgi:anaerobic magnesium-protoporphyrin IX monomethyl ester cyclase